MDHLYIPDKIKIGYNNRTDTYTGKLGYIIYYDHKNVLRKETSWQSWRDDNLGFDDFNNEPTAGFVLNKSGGGKGYSRWDARNPFIRIYDPRGFEFEISVTNLLFILQECTSTKGKGLEGEFVYAWAGTELVLLPVNCKEYTESVKYTLNQSKKITRTDMLKGCTYISKSMERLIYLGRHKIKDVNKKYWQYKMYQGFLEPHVRKDVFYDIDKDSYVYKPGLNFLAGKLSDEIHADYVNHYNNLIDGIEISKIVGLELVKITKDETILNSYDNFLIKNGNKYNIVSFSMFKFQAKLIVINDLLSLEQNYDLDDIFNLIKDYTTAINKFGYRIKKEDFIKNEDKLDLYTIKLKLESGKLGGIYGFIE